MTKKSLFFLINDFWAHFKEKIVKKAFKNKFNDKIFSFIFSLKCAQKLLI
jgi:hypothetical protein